MYTAINAWTFAAAVSVESQISAAQSAGFEGLELIVSEGSTTPAAAPADVRAVPLDLHPDQRRRLAQLAADAGVRITSLTGAMFFQANFASAEPAVREAARATTLRMLDMGADVGAGAIVIVPAVVGRITDAAPQVAYADALNRSYEALVALAREAESRGVMICIENVWNRFLLSPVETQEFIDRVNSPFVRVCFDTGNVLAFGYPQDWIDTLGGRIARVHVKDYDLAKPGRAGFCELGAGNVNWPAVMDALRRAGYDGPLIFEGAASIEDARQRLRNVTGY